MIIPVPKFGACLGGHGTLAEPHLNLELSVRAVLGSWRARDALHTRPVAPIHVRSPASAAGTTRRRLVV